MQIHAQPISVKVQQCGEVVGELTCVFGKKKRWWVSDEALGASQQWQGDTRDEKEGWIGNIDGIMEMDQVAIVGLNGISHLCWRGMN